MTGVRVRVHPHGTPLEREGVRRSNAKNESGLLPKFQNDLSESSYCVRARPRSCVSRLLAAEGESADANDGRART
jgi:hypothetical protein